MDITNVLTHIWHGAGLLLGGSLIIQISPIKINPWSWVLRKIGNETNKDLFDKIDEIDKKVEDLDKKVDSLECETNENNAKQNRRRILRFADECRREEKHSQEHFTEIIEGDIKCYNQYCRAHPEFENDKCVMSIDFIEKAYKHCIEHNDFL